MRAICAAAAAASLLCGCGKPVDKAEPSTAATTAPAPATAVAVVTAPSLAPDLTAAKARLTPDNTLQVVTFERVGSATVEGSVTGYKSTAYAVPIAAGQTLSVEFKSPSPNLYVNVVDAADQSGAALFHGETDGTKADLKAERDMTLLVMPYQPRAMARRNETGGYTLTVARKD